MPWNLSWEKMYASEYEQLKDEGYDTGNNPLPETQVTAELYTPFENQKRDNMIKTELTEKEWEKAYHKLIKVRDNGIQADFGFVEPNDLQSIFADAEEPPLLEPLGEDEYKERISGAWFGRCAAVVLGKPFEINVDNRWIMRYLQACDAYPLSDWAPFKNPKTGETLRNPECCLGGVSYVPPDDDTHYTIMSLMLAENKGIDFSPLDVCKHFASQIPLTWVYSATARSTYNFVNMTHDRSEEEQVAEFPIKLNPFREGINGSIRVDLWGYIAPGNPRRAAAIAYRDLSLNLVKNGIYAGMFTAACISTALSKNPSVEKIIQGGLSVIPKKSRLAAALTDVFKWYQKDKDWVIVCDKIYDKYGYQYFAHSIINMALTVLSIIHGRFDYTRVITTAVLCGKDTDCNSGTAGSIIGAALGYGGLDKHWIEPLNDTIEATVACFGRRSITSLADRTVDVWKKVRDIEL